MINKVYLYDENSSLDFKKIKAFLEKTFEVSVVVKKAKDIVVTNGLLLDVIGTQKKIRDTPGAYAIIVTKRLFATGDGKGRQMHLRSSVFSYPSVISLSGIVEAPAKPREYYLAKQSLSGSGLWEPEEARLKQKLKGRFIDYNDKRLLEVVKGLAAQAMFFYLRGEPFCKSKSCRLYNAHWQEDLIYSQVKSGKFCLKHNRLLSKITGRAK
ncbi:MAG: hypothetical protein Q8L26_04245 [Candidatus Omnitrophota bacterium]|nr:hypothetical protein [Candidatus Omnitrophota bacterium]